MTQSVEDRLDSTAPTLVLTDPSPGAGLQIDIHPRLVEEAVLLAIPRKRPQLWSEFHRQRDPLYEIDNADNREQRFRRLHGEWLVRLELAKPIRRCLNEVPSISTRASRCLVVPVVSAKDEYADLPPLADGADKPLVLLRLRSATLADEQRLVALLRRELLYIADMLDPDFGFDPVLALDEEIRPLEKVILERYRLLWAISVDGRLAAAGRIPAEARESRLQEFQRTFRMPEEVATVRFDRLFAGPRPSHAELLACASSPDRGGERTGRAASCPLCRMPTASLHARPEGLARSTLAAISQDFPDWLPAHGICRHCAEVYTQ